MHGTEMEWQCANEKCHQLRFRFSKEFRFEVDEEAMLFRWTSETGGENVEEQIGMV